MCRAYFWEGDHLNDKTGIPFQGHLVDEFNNGFVIYSKHSDNNTPVFGPDVDFTCLVASGLQYLKNKNLSVFIDTQELDMEVLSTIGFNFVSEPEQADYIINKSRDAGVSFSPSGELFEPAPRGLQTNPTFMGEIQRAWKNELRSVSQGAYVSREQYVRSLDQRINLMAQREDHATIWPMNFHYDQEQIMQLEPTGKIISWTKTTAAGSPSEFAFRSPILGGLTTVLVEFEKGTIGTFLIVDDHQNPVSINDEVELVIRRIYAQDGWIRYGLKAIPLKG